MPAGLPAELDSFVGRKRELAEGRRMLRSATLVTLVGPGGVGKTRLALRLAHQVGRSFPDGVVLVELGPLVDPDLLAVTTATALGLDPQGVRPEDAIAAYLRRRRLLLVLDNCEHVLGAARELVAGLLNEAPDVRVLATSRQPIGRAGEHVIVTEPLGVPSAAEVEAAHVAHVEAVALFADRARAVTPDFRVDPTNAALVARLCRALDGMPLAIELAAPRLRVLTLAQLVGRLDERLTLLTSGARNAPARHQTLRAVLDWSHELCSPEEQALWARMSVFDGGADQAALEAVCGESGRALADALAGLVDKSVVSTSQDDGRVRYRMLETIREYGAEHLADRGEVDELRSRHRAHYLAFAQESRAAWFGPDQLEWLARVGADLGNLRSAFANSPHAGDAEPDDLALASALAWYWSPAGAVEEGLRWFDRALGHERAASSALLHAVVDAIDLRIELVDMGAMVRLAQRALSIPTDEDTAADRAARCWAEAILAVGADDYAGAVTAFRLAGDEARAAGDLKMLVDAWCNVAVFLQVQELYAEALAVLDDTIALCDAHGERFKRRFAREFRGYLLGVPRGYRETLTALREGLMDWPVVQPARVANTLFSISKAHLKGGEPRQAAVLLGARVRIWHDFGVAVAPYEEETLEQYTKRCAEHLDASEFRAAYEQGYAMSAQEAVGFALGEDLVEGRTSSSQSSLPLSRRERQVAALVARGFSNKEIAEDLVISTRTAEGHVAKVMEKLGAHSREQVAARVGADPQE